MAYRLIYEEFWTDPRTLEEMSPEDKYFYLYLLTNPSTTSIGVYVITKKRMAFELGYSIETIESLMERFINHHKVITYNKETRELAIKNWGKYNLSRGGKPVMDCLTKELRQVKDKSLITYVGESILNQPIRELYLSFCDTLTNRGEVSERFDIRKDGNTDTKTNTNTLTNTEKEKYTEADTEALKYNNQTQCTEPSLNNNESAFNNLCTVAEQNNISSQNLSLSQTTDNQTESNSYLQGNTHFLETQSDQSLILLKYFETATGLEYTFNLGALKMAISQHSAEYVKKAMDKAIEVGKPTMSYVNGILKNWAKEGYPKDDENNKTTKSYSSRGILKFNDYEQRVYDYDDLERKLLYGVGKEGGGDND